MEDNSKKLGKSPTFEATLLYASLGWHIIPLSGKVPVQRDWPNQATIDSEQLAKWFGPGGQYKQHNIGMVCGPKSGVIVLDVDPRHGGTESLDRLESEHGRLPDTVEAITGGGGRHVIFKHPEGLKIGNSSKRLGAGLDIKSAGGQIVVAPSIHPDTGREYAWELSSLPGEVPLADLPPWIIAALEPDQSRKKAESTPADYTEGSRHDRLVSLGGSMSRTGLSDKAILAALIAENKTKCVPPLPAREVQSIAKSFKQYNEEGPTVIETDLSTEIGTLTTEATETEVKTVLKAVAKADPLEQERWLKEISAQTGRGKAPLKAILKRYLDSQTADDKRKRRAAKIDAADQVISAFKELIVVPLNARNQPERTNAHIIVKTDSAEWYLNPFWSPLDRARPTVTRLARDLLMSVGGDSGFDAALGGMDESAVSPTLESIRINLETDVEKGRIGQPCKISFGPYLDLETGKFHSKTDISAGIVVARGWSQMRGAEVVRTATEPREDCEAFGRWCSLFGDNWADALAHCLAAIANESPRGKHILGITGSADSGKTCAATWIAETIEGEAVLMAASGLDGSWPVFFSSRSPILDNLDNKSLEQENLDTLAAAITARKITVKARYTPSGLTEQAGYPIFTSIHSDILNHYRALKSRTIQLSQNHSDEIREIAGFSDEIIDAARPHIWWLVEQFVEAIRNGTLPAQPGSLRQINWARARWWIITHMQSMPESWAENKLSAYRIIDDDSDVMATPFVNCFLSAFNTAFPDGNGLPRAFRPTDILGIFQQHAPDQLENVTYSGKTLKTHPQPAVGISRMIDRARVGNRIGAYTIKDSKNRKNHRVYLVSFESKMTSKTEETRSEAGSPGSAGIAGIISERDSL